jgi:Trp operon repressor
MTRLSRFKLNNNVYQKFVADFFDATYNQDSPANLQTFLKHLLTPTEIETFAKRLAILKRLRKKLSYWEINDEVKVTGATITKMSNILQRAESQFLKILDRSVERDKTAERKRKESKFVKGSKQLFSRRLK